MYRNRHGSNLKKKLKSSILILTPKSHLHIHSFAFSLISCIQMFQLYSSLALQSARSFSRLCTINSYV